MKDTTRHETRVFLNREFIAQTATLMVSIQETDTACWATMEIRDCNSTVNIDLDLCDHVIFEGDDPDFERTLKNNLAKIVLVKEEARRVHTELKRCYARVSRRRAKRLAKERVEEKRLALANRTGSPRSTQNQKVR